MSKIPPHFHPLSVWIWWQVFQSKLDWSKLSICCRQLLMDIDIEITENQLDHQKREMINKYFKQRGANLDDPKDQEALQIIYDKCKLKNPKEGI